MDAVGFIFARAGSKGLPGKNIRLLAGKPLIAWSIEQALEVKGIRRLIVSTDSEEIAFVAKSYGAEVPFLRPSELSGDKSPEWFAWRHALEFLRQNEGRLPNAMVSIPATAPLRSSEDIRNALDDFAKGGADIVITVTQAHRNPYFNMVKINEDGSVGLVITPQSGVVRRQDAPEVYDMATVAYVSDPNFILANDSIFSGRVRAVEVPTQRAIDIDTLYDFELAEFLMVKKMASK
jgi:CMP-N-acetylneuraminic acid synthetase